jgi:hypothetical protein
MNSFLMLPPPSFAELGCRYSFYGRLSLEATNKLLVLINVTNVTRVVNATILP